MSDSKPPPSHSRRMPKNSMLYDKLVPIMLVVLGLVTATLIILATGIWLGVIAWH